MQELVRNEMKQEERTGETGFPKLEKLRAHGETLLGGEVIRAAGLVAALAGRAMLAPLPDALDGLRTAAIRAGKSRLERKDVKE